MTLSRSLFAFCVLDMVRSQLILSSWSVFIRRHCFMTVYGAFDLTNMDLLQLICVCSSDSLCLTYVCNCKLNFFGVSP